MRYFVIASQLTLMMPAFCQRASPLQSSFDYTYASVHCIPEGLSRMRLHNLDKEAAPLEFSIVVNPEGKVTLLEFTHCDEQYRDECNALMMRFTFTPACLNGAAQWFKFKVQIQSEANHQVIVFETPIQAGKRVESGILRIPF